MTKKEIRQIYNDLREEMTSAEFLERSGLQKETVEMILNREYWEAQIATLFPIRERLSCKRIFETCRATMFLLGREPEEGWMSFTYKYVCHILYPEKEFTEQYGQYSAGAMYFLNVLRFFFDREREALPFEPLKDFAFLTEEEYEQSENAEEYRRFLKYWHQEYVYEMMRLNSEVTKFKTLEHISGVHYVAMTMARGLHAAGSPVDLALVSGAAASHDLGKFGCKPNEKVPFMHYYYTALWSERHNLPYMGHIAANHSTWDLEPENLSVESLCLIYSDFRVKSSRGPDGVEITHISTLKDAFDVILHKFFNVDEKKVTRYRFVYAKLQDFETYMRAHGVDVDLNGNPPEPEVLPVPGLRTPEQVVQSLEFMAIEHNIDVMHQMTAERSFGNLLEAARSEKNWKNIRAYVNVLGEYFTYTNDTQKEQTIAFLYELFMHKEGEVRVYTALLMGQVFARFNAGYRKRRPEGMKDIAQEKVLNLWKHYLQIIIHPDYRLVDIQQRRIRSQLKNIMKSLQEYVEPSDFPMFMGALMEWYRNPEGREIDEQFVMMNSVEVFELERMEKEDVEAVGRFALFCARSENEEVRTAAWRALRMISEYVSKPERKEEEHELWQEIAETISAIPTDDSTLYTFLKHRIFRKLGLDVSHQEKLLYEREILTDIFLDNLKTKTPWVQQAANIRLLADQVLHGNNSHVMQIATHFSNMIKVGQYMLARDGAGLALLEIMPSLRVDQRNEIAVEMLRGLDTGEAGYARTIPRWLGKIALWLPPEQLDELIRSISTMLSNPSEHVTVVALDTVGTLLENYPAYRGRFEEDDESWRNRWKRMLGLLMSGLANYREPVHQEALLVLGQSVFGSDILTRDEKLDIFYAVYRKIYFLLTEYSGGSLTHYYRAASLTNLYRFITEHRLLDGPFEMRYRNKVAFFPGTFDPFTLSHKGIAKMIADMGFEVYLSVDEFRWSKQAQPHFIRRKIVSMSIADEFHVNIFPSELPINPGNPADLLRLKELFGDRELYLVVGSDVVAHASFYRPTSGNEVTRSMNHVVFRRVGDKNADSKYNREMMSGIKGKVVELELPESLEHISSTRIRENIDMNRDISNLIDPVAQEYIYSRGLYLREPEYKPIIQARAITFEEVPQPGTKLLQEIGETLLSGEEKKDEIIRSIRESGDRLLLLRNSMDSNYLAGAARIRYLEPKDLFSVLKDVHLCDMVRRNTAGEVLMISGLYSGKDPMIQDVEQLLLTEVVMRSYQHRVHYAFFLPANDYCPNRVISAVVRQGFLKPREVPQEVPLYMVDMHAPLILLSDIETTLKEPFSSNKRVLKVIRKAQQDLQYSMTKLYPGNLVISVSATVLYHRMVDKITKANNVPPEVVEPRQLGEKMCVPFGKILRSAVVPNTVTKTLHTEKIYDADLTYCAVEAYPNYTPLPTQVMAIKSYRRPVILVDDAMNRSGIRISTLAPLLRKEGVNIEKFLVGILTGYGTDLLAGLGLVADSVYYVPNCRNWCSESSLYPFIGGDMVRRSAERLPGLNLAINLIRPYTEPPLPGADNDALFEYSACCIRNARDVLLVLEQEYRKIFSRNLTLSRLSEAVHLPMVPDKGDCVDYDPNLSASVYLENDLQMLYRTRVNTAATKNRYTGL
ncbi:MAG: cytidyltransferase-related domain protein [Stomatobaculum sp.]|nr:cytidyltransferase-related domain protein [Stomatobaculum sp.]